MLRRLTLRSTCRMYGQAYTEDLSEVYLNACGSVAYTRVRLQWNGSIGRRRAYPLEFGSLFLPS